MQEAPPTPHTHCQHHGHHLPQLSSWKQAQRLGLVLCLNVGYGAVEFWGSHHTHSWALMSDAAHMAADASSVLLALLATLLSLWAQKAQAFKGAWWVERTAATLNALGLSTMSVLLFYEGLGRLQAPPTVLGESLLWIALGGLVVNAIAVRLFHHHHHNNPNLRGAYLHVLSDLCGSVAAMLSAGGVLLFNWHWLDALMSLLVASLVLVAAIQFWRSVFQAWRTPMGSPPLS